MTWFREHGRTLAALALLCLVLVARCSVPVAIATAPMLVIVEQGTVVYGQSGERISIPAGAELDVCADELGTLLHYELEPVVVRVPAPCAERPLFADGFEP